MPTPNDILRGSSFGYGERAEAEELTGVAGVRQAQNPADALLGGGLAGGGSAGPGGDEDFEVDPLNLLMSESPRGNEPLTEGLSVGPGGGPPPPPLSPSDAHRLDMMERYRAMLTNARTPEARAVAAAGLRSLIAAKVAARRAVRGAPPEGAS